MLNPFAELIITVLHLYSWVLLIYLILTWLTFFDILNRHNQGLNKAIEVLYRLTEPVLRYIRRFVPQFAGIDWSPVIAFILIRFLISTIRYYS